MSEPSAASAKAPLHLWFVGVFALLFNSIGVFDFVMSRLQGAAYLQGAGMTAEQIAHYMGLPAWMILDWAVGVFGAFIASFLLLMRRKLALPVYAVSLAAFLLSLFHTYVLAGAGAIMGRQMATVSAVIALLLALFIVYAWAMGRRGVLR